MRTSCSPTRGGEEGWCDNGALCAHSLSPVSTLRISPGSLPCRSHADRRPTRQAMRTRNMHTPHKHTAVHSTDAPRFHSRPPKQKNKAARCVRPRPPTVSAGHGAVCACTALRPLPCRLTRRRLTPAWPAGAACAGAAARRPRTGRARPRATRAAGRGRRAGARSLLLLLLRRLAAVPAASARGERSQWRVADGRQSGALPGGRR